MLEGFMESVRALTEVDTENFIINPSSGSPLQEAENGLSGNDFVKEQKATNHLVATDENRADENTGVNAGRTSTESILKRIGGLIRKISGKIFGRK
jgi:hypothetical protein